MADPASDVWKDVPHVVILCNFGGPASAEAVEPFLRRLFEDPFIIRAPLPLRMRRWLANRIATKRGPKALAEYREIGFSPINRMTEIQARHLEQQLQQVRPGTRVIVINRYTAPTSDEVLAREDLVGKRVFLITLYPHLCHSTTVSSLRDFDLALERRYGNRDLPNTRVFSWWQTPRYLHHTYRNLQTALEPLVKANTDGPISILFSAHGIPLRYHGRGDPYVNEIQTHFSELKRRGEAWLRQVGGHALLQRCHWDLSFQSRVGPVEWVKPYTEETIVELGKSRGGTLLLVPISFTADHIETLYEMDHTYQNLGLSSGFTRYARAVPSNDDPELATCLADALKSHGF